MSELVREKSEWLSSFDSRLAEAAALGEINVQRLACVAAAKAIIGRIEKIDSPELRLYGSIRGNRGDHADPTLSRDATIHRSYSDPIETDSATRLTIGRISVQKVWLPLGYTYYPKYFYIREFEGTDEDDVIWSPRNDARVRTSDYLIHADEPESPVDGTFAHLGDIRDNIQTFDKRIVSIADTLNVPLPSWADLNDRG